jgi:hypothetical protein
MARILIPLDDEENIRVARKVFWVAQKMMQLQFGWSLPEKENSENLV